MSRKPSKLYWVDFTLSRKLSWSEKRAGIRGGKRSSLRACQETRTDILRLDPDAVVHIYEAETIWKEVP